MPSPNYGAGHVGGVREKKQTMAELKLRRLTELNIRLREDLDRPRVKVSEAAQKYDDTLRSLIVLASLNETRR